MAGSFLTLLRPSPNGGTNERKVNTHINISIRRSLKYFSFPAVSDIGRLMNFIFLLFSLCSVSDQERPGQTRNSASLQRGENDSIPGKGDKIAETGSRKLTLCFCIFFS